LDKQYNLLPLFSTPIYSVVFNEDQMTNKSDLINYKFKRLEIDNGYISDSLHILDEPEFAELKNNILDELEFYTREVLKVSKEIEFYITNSWVMKHSKGDWSHPHAHLNSILSAVLYLDVNENSGTINFIKTKNTNNLLPACFAIPFTEWNLFNSDMWKILPEKNQLIIFPSSLEHSVNKSESNEDRYVLAFNVFIRGKFNSYLSELVIK
jgi:uncharacterized protein (TIGR02466 family)